jgi:TRAP transporter 4TM/12TM fusion protein
MNRSIDTMFKYGLIIFAFSIGVFHLLNVSGIVIVSTREIRIFHLVMMLVLLFMATPSAARYKDVGWDKLLRIALVVVTVASGIYLMSRWKDIAMSGGATVPMDATIGIVVILLVLEAARRGAGLALALLCTFFFTYPFFSEYLPGPLASRGYSLTRISEYMTTTSNGIFGVPLGVSSTYIILFSMYGAFLSAFGAGDFFFRLANRLTKGMLAAGAKTAVIFSTLLGMISGSAAGNVAVTGSLTIPMMKKEGYKPHQAGAIEAVVSTGGQIMPPVMGAAAFIMAEIIGVPYSTVMVSALIPAFLFFTSMFFVVHLQAQKNNLVPFKNPIDDDESIWMILLKGGQYIIPFVTLIVMMVYGYSPFMASFFSIILLLVCNVIWSRSISMETFQKIATAIIEGAQSVVPIAIACAAAGIIAGTLGITGLGSKISSLIIDASMGYTLLALILTMFTALILGMGLPTTAAYLILATVVAPALAKMGVPLLTAHMFVFFFGCVSTITPPVALASYVAAGIAKADINKVGWTAFGYGITCFILPYMFFYGPALMLQGPALEIVMAVISGIAGVFCIASGVVGYFRLNLKVWQRLILFLSGIGLMDQGIESNLLGLAGITLIWFTTSRALKKGAPISNQ